jgi:hypothetical protein
MQRCLRDAWTPIRYRKTFVDYIHTFSGHVYNSPVLRCVPDLRTDGPGNSYIVQRPLLAELPGIQPRSARLVRPNHLLPKLSVVPGAGFPVASHESLFPYKCVDNTLWRSVLA